MRQLEGPWRRPVQVVLADVLTEDEPQVPFTGISIWPRHSRRALPIQRPAIAFARGACTGVLFKTYDLALGPGQITVPVRSSPTGGMTTAPPTRCGKRTGKAPPAHLHAV